MPYIYVEKSLSEYLPPNKKASKIKVIFVLLEPGWIQVTQMKSLAKILPDIDFCMSIFTCSQCLEF